MIQSNFSKALAFLFAGAVLALSGSRPPWAADKLRFAISVKFNPSYSLPFFAAEEKGFWKQNEIDARLIFFDSGSAMFRGMAAQAVDMGLGGGLSDLQAMARGVPVIIVADLKSLQEFSVWVRADSPIKGPRDLKGAKIGISSFGGLVHAYGRALAKALGMEKEIRFMASGGSTQEIAALRAGVTDGTIFSFFGMAALKFKGEVREAVIITEYLPREWIDVTISARRDFRDQSPGAIRRGLKAVFQGADFVLKNPEWTVAKLKAEYGYEEKDARAVHRDVLRYGKDGVINPRALENMMNFLVEYGIVPREKAPPVKELYTDEFNN